MKQNDAVKHSITRMQPERNAMKNIALSLLIILTIGSAISTDIFGQGYGVWPRGIGVQ